MENVVARPGMVIADRYRLENEIGHGGYSLVFRATELRIGRPVAIKLLNKDSLDTAVAGRFQREAELARCLVHPNTVRLLDFDIDGRPSAYIVFELLEGDSLDRIVRREGPMSEERVGRITLQILKSLMEAHGAGIVHRDMKPANVFICAFAGEPDFVKVLDFGIAKSTDLGGTALTAAGTLVGTPRYMPPEQIRGVPPSPAMDIYAVGLLMAEMVAGAPVLRGTPMEACLKQLSNEPIELAREVVHSALHSVIRRAIEKDLSRRYASVAELYADIERLLPTLAKVVAPAPFSVPEEALSSGQIATQFMPEPAAPEFSPETTGNAKTVLAPLPIPRPRAVTTAPAGSARRTLLIVIAAVLMTIAIVLLAFTLWLIVSGR